MARVMLLLAAVMVAGIVYTVLTSPGPVEPPNSSVNEVSFDRIEAGMSAMEVEVLLGQPHRTGVGEVVSVEQPGSTEVRYAIDELSKGSPGQIVKVFDGKHEESICVLISEKNKRLIAAEYRVAGEPVLYRGQKLAVHSRIPAAGSSARVIDLNAHEHDRVKQYERKVALRKHASSSTMTSEAMLGPAPKSAAPSTVVAAPPPDTPRPPPPPVLPAVTNPAPTDQAEAMSAVPPAASAAVPLRTADRSTSNPAATSAASTPAAPPAESSKPVNWQSVVVRPGVRLSERQLQLRDDWETFFFNVGSEGQVMTGLFPNGNKSGMYSVKKAKLHGAAASYSEDGQLSTFAVYSNGELDGPLQHWGDDRKRLLFAEFSHGKRHGLVCLFRAGLPWLVQEWEKMHKEAVGQYLVKFDNGQSLVTAEADFAPEQDAECTRAQTKLDEVWAELHEGEMKLKKWVRQEDLRMRRG